MGVTTKLDVHELKKRLKKRTESNGVVKQYPRKKTDSNNGAEDKMPRKKHEAGSFDNSNKKVLRPKHSESNGAAVDEMFRSNKRQAGSFDNSNNKMLPQRKSFQGKSDVVGAKKAFKDNSDHWGKNKGFQSKSDVADRKRGFRDRSDILDRKSGFRDKSDVGDRKSGFQDKYNAVDGKRDFQDKRDVADRRRNFHDNRKSSFNDKSDVADRKRGFHDKSDVSDRKRNFHDKSDVVDRKSSFNDKYDAVDRKRGFQDKFDAGDQKRGFKDKYDAVDRKRSFHDSPDEVDRKRGFQEKSDIVDRKRGFQDKFDAGDRKRGFKDKYDAVDRKRSFQDKSDEVDRNRGFQEKSDIVDRKGGFRGNSDQWGQEKGFQNKADVGGEVKDFHDKFDVGDSRPRRKKKVTIRIDPNDISNKRIDDGISIDGKIVEKTVDPDRDNELSQNAQFRAIQPTPSILSFVKDNLLGRRRLIDLRRAGYNIELSAPLDNIPLSTSSERERIEEPVFRNKLTFFAAAKVASSFPPPELPEIAFAGRSNVGKSSLLNALTRQWGVVRTSDKPGLTQTINFFQLGPKLSLVDLPGYGFAYAKEEVKDAWEELVKEYVSTRVGLQRVCLLIDTKWGMKPRDHELIDLMERSETKYQIVMTKTDTVFPIDVARRAMQIEESLKANKSVVEPLMMVSSKSGAGIRSLRTVLAQIKRFAK